jgi:hypothetical protein
VCHPGVVSKVWESVKRDRRRSKRGMGKGGTPYCQLRFCKKWVVALLVLTARVSCIGSTECRVYRADLIVDFLTCISNNISVLEKETEHLNCPQKLDIFLSVKYWCAVDELPFGIW